MAPSTVALGLQRRQRAQLRRLEDGPPDEIIYYLLGRRRKAELTRAFLACLDRELERHPHVESYLKKSDNTI